MFRESLLESSQMKKRKRWPMAAAFVLEVIVTGLLVLIPLVTTGVIPVSAHVVSCPLGSVRLASRPPNNDASQGGVQLEPTVISMGNSHHRSITGASNTTSNNDEPGGPPTIGSPAGIPNLPFSSDRPAPIAEPSARRGRMSVLSEAQLLKKVEPIYPRIAVLTGKQGDVKLHAYIAKDGSIESLTVLSGDPLLIHAAVDAVRQWRYRPYILNGEPVEVETFITVSFKGIRD